MMFAIWTCLVSGIEFQLPLVASTPAAEAKTTGSPQMAATKTDLDEDEAPSQPVEKRYCY